MGFFWRTVTEVMLVCGRFTTLYGRSIVGKRNTGAAAMSIVVQRHVRNIHHRLFIGGVGYV